MNPHSEKVKESLWPITNSERLHAEQIEMGIRQMLDLASRGAHFTEEHALQNYGKGGLINWKTTSLFVLNDACSKVNAICVLLTLGFYSETASLLRSLLERVCLLSLFYKNRREANKWKILGLIDLDDKQKNQIRKLRLRAMSAYEEFYITGKDKWETLRGLIDDYSDFVHTSLRGCLMVVGVNPTIDQLLGPNAEKILELARSDFNGALKLLELVQQHVSADDVEVSFGHGIAVNHELISDHSYSVLALSHHLEELAAHIFGELTGDSLKKRQKWHTEVIKTLQGIS
ncbi:hypothetical protein KAR91_58770 [Candidatus Pacearchaeota archaeon]|nr:hypothetical protein [Candidatus Pacearchaeota archaeon]